MPKGAVLPLTTAQPTGQASRISDTHRHRAEPMSLTTPRRLLIAGATAIALGLAVAGPAEAGSSNPASTSPPGISLTGCSGSGTSLSSSGTTLQTATAPRPPTSSSHPVLVEPNGTVTYQGSSSAVITNNSWHIKVAGITVKSGGGKNSSHKTAKSGTEKVSSYLPFTITGLAYVSGSLTGDGGSCTGSMWIKLAGNPAGTVPWFIGFVLALGGLAGMYFSRPKVVT